MIHKRQRTSPLEEYFEKGGGKEAVSLFMGIAG